MNRSLWLLVLCQGLFLTNNVTFIAINGLVGLALAPAGWMATLPVMGYVVGGAMFTAPSARLQQRFGRRRAFQIGAAIGALACLVCAFAALERQFVLLCLGTVLAGFYNANAQLYRFAAAELAPPNAKERAVSWVLAGGLIGAVIGPNLAQASRTLMSVPFSAAYFVLAGVAVLACAFLQFMHFADAAPAATPKPGTVPRRLREIVSQPLFIVSATLGALSFGLMNLLMAATPLAMQMCGLAFSSTATVLEWHVIGMFAPGFFTGDLIKRFGALRIMTLGLALNAACVAIALSGQDMHQFLAALLVLGVGWNFLFTGATSIALKAYAPEDKDRAQAALNFCQFAVLAISSFSSGALVTAQGWQWLNAASVVPLAVMAAALYWLSRLQIHNAAIQH